MKAYSIQCNNLFGIETCDMIIREKNLTKSIFASFLYRMTEET